ncbi:MAG: TIM barrel protein [Verrucomicrobiae bacterium]|nr:TIM barrel protein [Verrucomicrobiae bacterium]
MIHTGLVSITFRKLSPEQIIELVVQAGLEGVEWGGDVHVPHGHCEKAGMVRKMTGDAGLKTASYGSYYRVGHEELLPFESVLETALALRAPVIRVWAGKKGSAEADDGYFEKIVEDSRRIGELSAREKIKIGYECHGGTLTDTPDSAVKLLKAVGHENVGSYWQPAVGATGEVAVKSLQSMLPWLVHVHAFHWRDGAVRCLLEEGADRWNAYLQTIKSTARDHFVLMEFVKDDLPGNFLKDAKTLKNWVQRIKENR